jgi:hypothetical protein
VTCDDAKSEMLDDASSVELAAHRETCAACRDYAARVRSLEVRWRSRPLPARAELAKQAFLDRLATPAVPASPSRRRWRWSVAAVCCLLAGSALILFWPGDRVEARDDVLDQLIDWNLEVSEAATSIERQRIWDARQELLRLALRQAKLDQRERDLGERLLANAAWMAGHEDPIEELRRFHEVADRLLDGVNQAGPDVARSNKFARQFARVSERGIDRNVDRIKPEKLADPEWRGKYHRLARLDADLAERVRGLVDQAPDLTKRELRRALEASAARERRKKSLGFPHEPAAAPLNP